MSIIETSDLPSQNFKSTENELHFRKSSFIEPDETHHKSSAEANLSVANQDEAFSPLLVKDASVLVYPPVDRPPYSQNELLDFVEHKPEILAIVCGLENREQVNGSNVAYISLTSPSAWRLADQLRVVQLTLVSLANMVGQVAVVGKSYPISKEVEFQMKALAAALRRESKARVLYLPMLSTNGSTITSHAFSEAVSEREALESTTFLPLGYREKTSFFWSVSRKCVLEFSPSDMISAGTLTLLCGDDWLREKHGYLSRTGQYKVDYRDVGVRIMEECSKKGIYKISNIYGTGVWVDPSDSDCLIVNSGDNIWRTDGKIQPRVGERFVYTASRTLDLRPIELDADPWDARAFLAELLGWNWKRSCDPIRLLGWLMSAFVVGAHDWRVHAAITGKKGTGKSSLLAMIRALLGDFLISCSGSSTEPSIRRHIKNDALVIIVDEAEKDSPNIKAVMSYLRASSSGDKDMKANRNDGVDVYTVRSTGLISAVDLPQFLPADEGRYVLFSLVGAPIGQDKPILARENNDKAQKLGIKMKSRMIHSWPRYRYCLGVIRSVLITQENMTQRYADSLSTILGAAWIALHDGVISEDEAREFISQMDFSEEKEQLKEAVDDSSFIDHALDTVVTINSANKIEKITLRMATQRAANNDRIAEKSIQMYGLRVMKIDGSPRLLIDEKNAEFKKLYVDTKWNSGDFITLIKRIPGVSPRRHEGACIGGKTARAFSVPIDVQNSNN